MTWWAIDVRGEAARRDALAAWLVRTTGLAVEERPDGTLVSFADTEAGAERLIDRLRAEHGEGLQITRRALEPTDWSTRWREGLGPRRLGRLVVAPSWVAYAPGPEETVVVLDPETAFGSGEHGSTRVALRLLERLVAPGDRVLDLGSGSGILAIAAVRLGASRAVGIETDAEANDVAARNAERNGVADRARFLAGDAADLAPLLGPADLVLSNILRTVNVALLPAILASLRPGGIAIFAGMEEAEAAEFRGPLAAAGFEAVEEAVDAGWWGVAARRAGAERC
ncbi:MAG TPA: 50S ribosomal protein L11 methyltransferase [Gemmatimonadales bacterium]|nr:50S ribosomal protein L11 methyltransferase [Gemmatimonadales bacterium]